MRMKKYAIIVAGGSGKRMQTETPKQFLKLSNQPILMLTLKQFHLADKAINLLVVLPKDHIDTWEALCAQYDFTVPHQVVEGGQERFFSVKNGLDEISGDGLVAIHDGVRPFVSVQKINNAFIETKKLRATTLAVPLKDSIRILNKNGSKAVDRDAYQLVQTPQTFHLSLIKKAYEQPFLGAFTDDASVVEALGETVCLIEGDYTNIKITSPEDLVIGEAILASLK
jgi:2-C-methyl-D-erythritol 4-phosphate cytidylyltransferase